MPRRLSKPTESMHFLFFKEDLDWLKDHYGENSPRGMKMNVIIRGIIHEFVKAKKNLMVKELEQGEEAS